LLLLLLASDLNEGLQVTFRRPKCKERPPDSEACKSVINFRLRQGTLRVSDLH
jgi:hypothetical protein